MDTTTDTRREITAFFDDRPAADRAKAALISAGISSDSIRMVEGDTAGSSTSSQVEEKGFFEMLGDMFMPAEDRSVYAEGLRRGGYVVTVTASGALADTAIHILDDEGSVDMDERSQSYASEGWSAGTVGYGAPGTGIGMAAVDTMGGGSTGAGSARSGPGASDATVLNPTAELHSDAERSSGLEGRQTMADPTMSETSMGQTTGGYDDTTRPGGADTISRAEERLQVGKRDVSHGRVRVRSYVVETPASADVSLRSERVEIHRNPVDRPIDASDDPFQDRTIELNETSEEAVVTKVARVVEEIDVSKSVDERTETVSETVRHTEVEIEDDRDAPAARPVR